MEKAVALSINASWNVVNFRAGLVRALGEEGWKVLALTPEDDFAPRLAGIGARHVPIAIDSAGISPFDDARLLLRYRRTLRRLRPAAFLGFTAKPNIWGSLAAQSLGIPVINNVSGLGTAFLGHGPLRAMVSMLYRAALRRSAVVFFQNPDDRDLFVAQRLVRPERARLLPGSGVDLDRFRPAPPPAPGPFAFLFVGRLLWQKGVREFVEAARIVRAEAPDARFRMLGFLDAPNRSAVARADVEAWQAEGLIDYLGAADDVRPHLAAADCVVLPSWREGLPRALLEAAATARPVIATDVPGCRHLVAPDTGMLCAARDPRALAEAMLCMLRLSPADRAAMGAAGRARAERDYGEDRVIAAYLEALGEVSRR